MTALVPTSGPFVSFFTIPRRVAVLNYLQHWHYRAFTSLSAEDLTAHSDDSEHTDLGVMRFCQSLKSTSFDQLK